MIELSDIAALKRHLLQEALAQADGSSMFSRECIDRQIGHLASPVTTMTLVTMLPTEFLSLASPVYRLEDLPADSDLAIIEQDKLDCIRHGVSGSGLSNLPHLRIETEGADARVIEHEGRHRALTAIAMGITAFPVQVTYQPDGYQAHDGMWHLMDVLPERLLGQDGHHDNAIPMPTVHVTRHDLGIDEETADRLGQVSRTLTRVLYDMAADDREDADVRAWAEGHHPDALRWMERQERMQGALEHLESLETETSPRP